MSPHIFLLFTSFFLSCELFLHLKKVLYYIQYFQVFITYEIWGHRSPLSCQRRLWNSWFAFRADKASWELLPYEPHVQAEGPTARWSVPRMNKRKSEGTVNDFLSFNPLMNCP